MTIVFLTLLDISNVNERGIYHDLLRKFRDEGHKVCVVFPAERRHKVRTSLTVQDGISLLRVRTLNIQRTNVVEKGLGTLLLERQYLGEVKKHLSHVQFDLVLYSTPPITLTKVISYIKKKDKARSYLLLKDIFPQNAVDLGMITTGGALHRFFLRAEKKLYEVSDFIGCMSPANVQFLLSHNPELDPGKVEVNPNSIEPVTITISEEERLRVREKYNIPPDAIVLIYGGNLGKPQGIPFLLEVMTSRCADANVYFLIVGSGTESSSVQSWFETECPNNAKLFPGLPKHEYDDLVKACDIGLIFLDKRFTIPNFPSRLLSYLENKMPVIAATDRNTDIGKIIEQNNCGFWAESGDLKAFNDHLDKFVTDRDLVRAMGDNGNKLLKDQYTVGHSYGIIINRLQDV